MVKPEFKTCHQCSKEFLVAVPTDWVYKIDDHTRVKFFCSYTCIQKFRRKKEEEQNQRKLRYTAYRRAKAKKEEPTIG